MKCDNRWLNLKMGRARDLCDSWRPRLAGDQSRASAFLAPSFRGPSVWALAFRFPCSFKVTWVRFHLMPNLSHEMTMSCDFEFFIFFSCESKWDQKQGVHRFMIQPCCVYFAWAQTYMARCEQDRTEVLASRAMRRCLVGGVEICKAACQGWFTVGISSCGYMKRCWRASALQFFKLTLQQKVPLADILKIYVDASLTQR